jgi:hypothetical protein
MRKANPKRFKPARAAKQIAARADTKQTIRRSKPAPARQNQIAETLRRLELVSKQGAKNKLPGATSDHSFLYTEDGMPR